MRVVSSSVTPLYDGLFISLRSFDLACMKLLILRHLKDYRRLNKLSYFSFELLRFNCRIEHQEKVPTFLRESSPPQQEDRRERVE